MSTVPYQNDARSVKLMFGMEIASFLLEASTLKARVLLAGKLGSRGDERVGESARRVGEGMRIGEIQGEG